MSDQVHKTLLACDGLNRTGQEAPASCGAIYNVPPNIAKLAKYMFEEGCTEDLFLGFSAIAKMNFNQKKQSL